MAGERVAFQGLPARICWLGYGERHLAGLKFNEMVASGELKAPIVIGRDHLDCGSVASPYRETEAMLDGSDAIADWAILNALVNTASGATWVSFHHGGGVGMGRSLHAGQVCVADGTELAAQKIERVLTNDPGMGVIRHVDAGYDRAVEVAEERGVRSHAEARSWVPRRRGGPCLVVQGAVDARPVSDGTPRAGAAVRTDDSGGHCDGHHRRSMRCSRRRASRCSASGGTCCRATRTGCGTPRPGARSAGSTCRSCCPALMGLFAQVGRPGTTTDLADQLRRSIAVVGLVTTLRALPHSRRPGVDDRANRVAAVVIYALVAVVGVVPEVAERFDLTGIQVEAILLILLVLLAHGLVWRFMTSGPPEGEQAGRMTTPQRGVRARSAAGSATWWPAYARTSGTTPRRSTGWAARDVVGTSSSGSRRSSSGGAGVDLPTGPSVDDDPAGAWQHLQREVQALLDDPASAERVLSNPHIGDVAAAPGGLAVLHRRRLHAHLGPGPRHRPGRHPRPGALRGRCWPGWSPSRTLMRQSGQYGPRVEVAEDADAQTRMLGFIGRDPLWQPPQPT